MSARLSRAFLSYLAAVGARAVSGGTRMAIRCLMAPRFKTLSTRRIADDARPLMPLPRQPSSRWLIARAILKLRDQIDAPSAEQIAQLVATLDEQTARTDAPIDAPRQAPIGGAVLADSLAAVPTSPPRHRVN